MSMNISHIIISSCENNEWHIIKECLATCPINHSFYIQRKARLGEATRQIVPPLCEWSKEPVNLNRQ